MAAVMAKESQRTEVKSWRIAEQLCLTVPFCHPVGLFRRQGICRYWRREGGLAEEKKVTEQEDRLL